MTDTALTIVIVICLILYVIFSCAERWERRHQDERWRRWPPSGEMV